MPGLVYDDIAQPGPGLSIRTYPQTYAFIGAGRPSRVVIARQR
jgi:hypothetical protein